MIERDGDIIRIYAPRKKKAIFAALAGILTLALLKSYLSGWTGVEVVILLGASVLTMLGFLASLFRRTLMLEINNSGLRVAAGMMSRLHDVPWQRIQNIRLQQFYTTHLLAIELKPEFAAEYGRLAPLTFRQFGFHLSCPFDLLPGDRAQLMELVLAKWNAQKQ